MSEVIRAGAKKVYKEIVEGNDLDGTKPIYIVGIPNHEAGFGKRLHATYDKVITVSDTPLFGHWKSHAGIRYLDVSYLEQYESDEEARDEANNFRRTVIMKIHSTGEIEFI